MAGVMTKQRMIESLTTDLAAEQADAQHLVATLDDESWSLDTPAEGWTIHDQVCHLAHFDFVARLAIADPSAFIRFRDDLPDLQALVDNVGRANLSRDPENMRNWWRQETSKLCDAALRCAPDQRVPWFGPTMSLASKITARIMETWAHGQDIRDTLGVRQKPSPRLPHVARIGVLALPNSYLVRGLPVPDTPVRVELDSPDGSLWTAGPDDATDVVSGPMEDFCLVVTQRRHRDDTALHTTGDTATRWMSLAQAFAGQAGTGRRPGQFPRTHLSPSNGVSS